MILLILLEELAAYKGKDLVPLSCENCQQLFYKTKQEIQVVLKATTKKNRNRCKYCTPSCEHAFLRKGITINCSQCGSPIIRTPAQLNASGRAFCNKSCAATYNNQHKTHGTRRSKLEAYLATQISIYYPEIPCLFNNKTTIGSELDFYFPTLKLAIELNGIFHYEPIYGKNTLERIQDNDAQKSIHCYEQGIEFCSIDSSSCKYLNQIAKDKYWNILNKLLQEIIGRTNEMNLNT